MDLQIITNTASTIELVKDGCLKAFFILQQKASKLSVSNRQEMNQWIDEMQALLTVLKAIRYGDVIDCGAFPSPKCLVKRSFDVPLGDLWSNISDRGNVKGNEMFNTLSCYQLEIWDKLMNIKTKKSDASYTNEFKKAKSVLKLRIENLSNQTDEVLRQVYSLLRYLDIRCTKPLSQISFHDSKNSNFFNPGFQICLVLSTEAGAKKQLLTPTTNSNNSMLLVSIKSAYQKVFIKPLRNIATSPEQDISEDDKENKENRGPRRAFNKVDSLEFSNKTPFQTVSILNNGTYNSPLFKKDSRNVHESQPKMLESQPKMHESVELNTGKINSSSPEMQTRKRKQKAENDSKVEAPTALPQSSPNTLPTYDELSSGRVGQEATISNDQTVEQTTESVSDLENTESHRNSLAAPASTVSISKKARFSNPIATLLSTAEETGSEDTFEAKEAKKAADVLNKMHEEVVPFNSSQSTTDTSPLGSPNEFQQEYHIQRINESGNSDVIILEAKETNNILDEYHDTRQRLAESLKNNQHEELKSMSEKLLHIATKMNNVAKAMVEQSDNDIDSAYLWYIYASLKIYLENKRNVGFAEILTVFQSIGMRTNNF
jgi:hypothetical protein